MPAAAEPANARRDTDALPAVRALLRTEDQGTAVVIAALDAVGAYRDRASIPHMLHCLNSGNRQRDIRAAAVRALTAISGKPYGDDRARWVSWYVAGAK